jgi:hypothetical protein
MMDDGRSKNSLIAQSHPKHNNSNNANEEKVIVRHRAGIAALKILQATL